MADERVPPWTVLGSFLARGPRYLFEYGRWRAARALARRFEGPPAWPLAPELDPSRAAALREHHRARTSPAPLCAWPRREEVAAAVSDVERRETVRAADLACARCFRFRGREVDFAGGPIDWRACPDGNTDWTWDLNRHHFLVTLGRAYWYTLDERYVRAFGDLVREWIAANPPGTEAPAWQSVFEVGVRAASWSWAHALFLEAPALDDAAHLEVLRGLHGMGEFLRRRLERHAWNNHLLLEAKALAMLGILYPELPGAAVWARDGERHLRRELERQVLPDGVHSERSSFYHKLIASELLELAVVGRLAGRETTDLDRSLRSLLVFLEAITREDGSIPMLGDASRDDEHIRFDPLAGAPLVLGEPAAGGERSLDEGTAWLAAALGPLLRRPAAAAPARPRDGASRAFPAGGYWVMRAQVSGVPLHLVFDCGPFGDRVVAGHGHADALSIDLALGADDLIIDPGMYSAHLGESWRNFFRGTAAHNTVMVDGRDQTVLRGVRRAYRPAPARCLEWVTNIAFDLAAGEHGGYRRLREPITHRRRVFLRKAGEGTPDVYIIVIDSLEGVGSHRYDLHFHLPPGARVEADSASLAVTVAGSGGGRLAILPLGPAGLEVDVVQGETQGPQGWVALLSGVKEPAPVVRYRRQGPAPAAFVTVLVPLTSRQAGTPRLEAIEVLDEATGAREGRSAAGRLQFAGGGEDFLVPLAERPALLPGRRLRAGSLITDARLAAVGWGMDGRPRSAAVAGGSFIERGGAELFRAPAGVARPAALWLEGRGLLSL